MVPLVWLLAGVQESPAGRGIPDVALFNGTVLRHTWGDDSDGQGPVQLDFDTPFDSRPSVRIAPAVPGPWSMALGIEDGRTFDLSGHHPRGELVMVVRGAAAGERFRLQISDRNLIRRQDKIFGRNVTIPANVWSTLRIPLRELIPDASVFLLDQTWFIRLQGTGPATFWIGDLRFTTPDRETAPAAIRVNQMGWAPWTWKRAVISGFPETLGDRTGRPFRVIDAADGRVALNGRIGPRTSDPVESGEDAFEVDVTSLRRAGRYFIEVEGVPASPVFEVGRGLARRLLADAGKALWRQRSGYGLTARFAGDFPRPAGHPGDSAAGLPGGRTMDAAGGWYDGGAYRKSTATAAEAVLALVRAQETFPDLVRDGELDTAPTDRLPDLLNEAVWGGDWLLKMQDPATGLFFAGVGFEGEERLPHQDRTPRVVSVGTEATPAAIKALASLARVLAAGSPDMSRRFRQAAERGWTAWEATGMPASLATAAALARVSDLPGPRAVVAAWSGPSAEDRLDAHWADLAAARPELRGRILTGFLREADRLQTRAAGSPWRNLTPFADRGRGGNSRELESLLALAVTARALGRALTPYDRLMVECLDGILGVNPLGRSFVSGFGERSVRRLHSKIYSNDAIEAVPPGYLVGGPNAVEGDFLSLFPARRHRDVATDWALNDVSITANARLVFAAAWLAEHTGGRQG
ncbi:MAG: glycoside hydrolase family 9 protein [Fimbriimonadaceae bacterium]|nr:glycoside hydrolase family 9 protein [Fimbriimonadaceae bacterium]